MKRVLVALAALAALALAAGPALALNPQPLPPRYKLFYLFRR